MDTSIFIHTTGLAGIDGQTVATFRRMQLEAALAVYEAYYSHPAPSGFVVDDYALTSVIYLSISEADIEAHGVLVIYKNPVVNR